MSQLKSFDSSDKKLHIGDVFTPLLWGEFAVSTFGIYDKWLAGATIFDPTMGEGNLLEALITFGISKGKLVNELPTERLFGNELNTQHFECAIAKFDQIFGLDMHSNFTNCDLLQLEKRSFDILFGNPPWQNFVDLPDSYKQQIKPYFFDYHLAENPKQLLLGGSRIDLSALITVIALKDFLTENGEAFLFLPLSLFLNDGANKSFRSYSIGNLHYSLQSIHDFNAHTVFPGVKTRFGLVHILRNQTTNFPIPYARLINETWEEYSAKPLFQANDPLSVFSPTDNQDLVFSPLKLTKESTPRQGINTCGANDLFFFDQVDEHNSDHYVLSNKDHANVILPKEFVYPLITTSNFNSTNKNPSKWVLLPYNVSGKPLNWEQIKQSSTLATYLEQHEKRLTNRKGIMLNSWIDRGYWWALLGVGAYTFFPFKIVWEAYGKSTFNPTLFSGNWQANQSLQAFIPVKTEKEATAILTFLSAGEIQTYLSSLRMQGTMNWAQPGKIKKFITFED